MRRKACNLRRCAKVCELMRRQTPKPPRGLEPHVIEIIGAWGDDASGEDAGAAYVFVREKGTWIQKAKPMGMRPALDLEARTIRIWSRPELIVR